MNIRTVQWNIGGAIIRAEDGDPSVESNYCISDLEYIVETIRSTNADIITLQEVHADATLVQAAEIARQLGFSHLVYDKYADSHLEAGQSLGQAIISRFPILSHNFALFENPGLSIVRPNGDVWKMHDKGVTKCLLNLGDSLLEVQTLHMPPWRKFGVDALDEQFTRFRDDYGFKLQIANDACVIQGDFNFDADNVFPFISGLASSGFEEAEQKLPTTPKGCRYDHVVYRGVRNVSLEVLSDVRTDHYPIVVEFSVG